MKIYMKVFYLIVKNTKINATGMCDVKIHRMIL